MELCGWQKAKYINNVCKGFVALYTITICTTDTYRPEKKDQVLKAMYIAWLIKLSIKHLFICCGKYNT